jgi:hypothetical protein
METNVSTNGVPANYTDWVRQNVTNFSQRKWTSVTSRLRPKVKCLKGEKSRHRLRSVSHF